MLDLPLQCHLRCINLDAQLSAGNVKKFLSKRPINAVFLDVASEQKERQSSQ